MDMALAFVLEQFGRAAADDLAANLEYDGNYLDGSKDHWGISD